MSPETNHSDNPEALRNEIARLSESLRMAEALAQSAIERAEAAEQRALEAQREAFAANQRADQDPQTGLLNKQAWRADIEKRIESNKPFGIIFIDIDKFKQVNTKYGHVTADKLIDMRARLIRKSFNRKSDSLTHETLHLSRAGDEQPASIGRYGGDEFGVVFDLSEIGGKHRPGTVEEAYEAEIGHARFVLSLPITMKDESGSYTIRDFGATIGAALWTPGCSLDVSGLIEQADQAMLAAKAPVDQQAQKS